MQTTWLQRGLIGISLLGLGCAEDEPYTVYALDGITVLTDFDEPICGGTFAWMENRLRLLVAETGLPASATPIRYYWLRDAVFDFCPSGSCALGNRIYTPLEVFSHELVHGHFSQLGRPRSWLVEGMAAMLEDKNRLPNDPPQPPSQMLAIDEPIDLYYQDAGSFVRHLRNRFGMPRLLELYAALDRVDVDQTRTVFRQVLGVDWDDVEADYLAGYVPELVGLLDCDFPVLTPEGDTWTLPVTSTCDDPSAIGPFLGWFEDDAPYPPYLRHHVIVDIEEAGTYLFGIRSSTKIGASLKRCAADLEGHGLYMDDGGILIELAPGRWRLMIDPTIDDASSGEVILQGPRS